MCAGGGAGGRDSWPNRREAVTQAVLQVEIELLSMLPNPPGYHLSESKLKLNQKNATTQCVQNICQHLD